MHRLIPVLLFLAPPFWEAKPPERWSITEIGLLRVASPWAQQVGPAPPVEVYFATARPIEEAETELRIRSKSPPAPPDPDYLTYLSANRDHVFVLAIPYQYLPNIKEEDEKRMSEESVMVIGRKSYHMLGHFPPVATDPVLRMVFPREIQPTDKRVVFKLYVPGVEFPDRQVDFPVKDLAYHGKLEV